MSNRICLFPKLMLFFHLLGLTLLFTSHWSSHEIRLAIVKLFLSLLMLYKHECLVVPFTLNRTFIYSFVCLSINKELLPLKFIFIYLSLVGVLLPPVNVYVRKLMNCSLYVVLFWFILLYLSIDFFPAFPVPSLLCKNK